MADFVAVLKKTIDGMGETTPQMRERVYDKARSTIAAKLAAIDPPPPAVVAERQKRTLEDAIAVVEKAYVRPAPPAPPSDPLAELESIFSSIDRNRNTQSHVRPAPPARTEPARAEPARQAPLAVTPALAPASRPAERAGAPSFNAQAEPVERPSPAPVAPRPGPEDSATAAEEFPAYPASGPETDLFQEFRSAGRARRRGGLVAALVVLVAIAAGAYGVWLNADAFKSMLGAGDGEDTVTVEPLASVKTEASTDEAASAPAAPATTAPAAAPDAAETPKFTQRLTPDGKEVDAGPAGGETTIGEGTSVVALTAQPPQPEPPAAPAAGTTEPAEMGPAEMGPAGTEPASSADTSAAAASEQTAPEQATPEQGALAVGQKAIFYEERTNVAQGSAEPGSIVWSLVQESPGGDAPPEPAIRAEANIPGKNVQLRMTIRRNADETLPASHIVELIFLTPENFEGGGIDNILRMAMKTSEQDAGNPLIGIPAKIADGFFLVALNDTKADEQANLALLRGQDWIDIPIIYKSGRRALITMEKGIPGDKVFEEALKAWQAKTAG